MSKHIVASHKTLQNREKQNQQTIGVSDNYNITVYSRY